jgi:hypothetical protein
MRVHQLSINSLSDAMRFKFPPGVVRKLPIYNRVICHFDSRVLKFDRVAATNLPILSLLVALCRSRYVLEYFLAVCPPDAESLLRIARAHTHTQMKAAVIFCPTKIHCYLRFDSLAPDCCQTF